jgi:hypothetical protein
MFALGPLARDIGRAKPMNLERWVAEMGRVISTRDGAAFRAKNSAILTMSITALEPNVVVVKANCVEEIRNYALSTGERARAEAKCDLRAGSVEASTIRTFSARTGMFCPTACQVDRLKASGDAITQ